ncbi:hypothetical protein RGC52_05980 [Helicobacter pylori]|uniref:hypothetical protein n=1 Tax=Helicobacter pylori TaxID=210 RepID=UPI002928E873|nr:hypothetical protein [Helicobacter pylori]MDU9711272.1 hypothetical protein [Helicobacter pylori]
MKEMSSYQKRKAELKAKDQIIESKNETIEAQKQTIEVITEFKDQVIEFLKGHSSPEESYRDEGKEHSKSCLGFE